MASKEKEFFVVVEVSGDLGCGELDMRGAECSPNLFPSMPAAERWLRNDAAESLSFDCGDTPETDFSDWGGKFAICKVMKVVRPTPKVSVKWSLENCEIGK